MEKELLEIFKCMMVPKTNIKKKPNYRFMTKGILLDFNPDDEQEEAIKQYARDANVSTMFSVEEVNNFSTDEKITKQLLHYILQFGTNYTLDVMRSTDASDTMTITLIRGVTRDELQTLLDDSLYSNRPVKDSKALAGIIRYYELKYRINDIKNNEIRVLLFDAEKDKFNNGDDAVRYIVNTCAGSDLLIKSEQVIAAVKANPKVSAKFLNNHQKVLSEVFNRHKTIIMAVKVGTTSSGVKTAVNKISHLSKKTHKPYVMPLAKTFVSDVFKDFRKYRYKNLNTFTLRDKLKLLNLLEFKHEGLSTDIFVIRNGKTHVAQDRPVYVKEQLSSVIAKVLEFIKNDLKPLREKVIILPEDIDYGLPVSRKQSVGNLPFGTKLTVTDKEISSGVYWKNDWGARDIDLSAVDLDGNRTGWGTGHGYDRGGGTGVQFSGDIVNAPNGGMEFLTSSQKTYGLFANIFNGELGAKVQIIVGERARKNWIDKTYIQEEIALKSRGNLVGFVQGKTFTVFYGRMNESRMSGARNKVMIQKALTMRWTVKALFGHLGIAYVAHAEKPDHDLSYAGFTYDKLESLFGV